MSRIVGTSNRRETAEVSCALPQSDSQLGGELAILLETTGRGNARSVWRMQRTKGGEWSLRQCTSVGLFVGDSVGFFVGDCIFERFPVSK